MIQDLKLDGAEQVPWRAAGAHWERASDALQGLPHEELESVQLGRGKSVRFTTYACGRDLMLSRSWVGTKCATHIVPAHDWGTLTLPLASGGEYRFNGHELRPADLVLTVSRDGYSQHLDRRDAITVPIRKSRLVSACTAIAGLTPGDIMLRDIIVSLHTFHANKLHAALLAKLGNTFERPIGPGRFRLLPVEENDLFSLIARTLVPYIVDEPPQQALTERALEIVQAAKAACKDASTPPSIADLCAAAGVGEAWLHRSFVEVCGISPARFIRCRRLTTARDRLLDRASPPRSVKDVALSLGFLESGRFARDYRSLFGEKPSETLLRASAS